jgi:hypothetical protein
MTCNSKLSSGTNMPLIHRLTHKAKNVVKLDKRASLKREKAYDGEVFGAF